MDIKDSYLHGTVGVVKSISVDADKLKYKLADIDGTVKEVTLPSMVAATSDTDGKPGLVPTPSANSLDKYLKGDGTWSDVDAAKLGGINPIGFMRVKASYVNNTSISANDMTDSGSYRLESKNEGLPLKPNYGNVLVVRGLTGVSYGDTLAQMFFPYFTNAAYLRTGNTDSGSYGFTNREWSRFVLGDDKIKTTSDTDKGVKVELSGTFDEPKIDVTTTFGDVAISNSSKAVSGEAIAKSVPLLMGGNGTVITSGSDLNTRTYCENGTYYTTSANIAQSLTNCPSATAFIMHVYTPNGLTSLDSAWSYRTRKILDLLGKEWVQRVYIDENKVIQYEPWHRILREDTTFTQATASTVNGTQVVNAGIGGAVPAPQTLEDNSKFLKGDGTWSIPSVSGKVSNDLTLKINSGTTEDTSQYTYNGAAAKTLDIKEGSNITLTAVANTLTITASDTKVTQENTTDDSAYRVLLGNNNDTTETTTTRKSAKLLFNPSTGTLAATTFRGNLTGVANSSLYLDPIKVDLVDANNLKVSDQKVSFISHISDNSSNLPEFSSWANGLLNIGLHSTSKISALLYFSANKPLYYRSNTDSDWKQIAYTDSDITGNAATADKLKNKVKLWGLDFDGSSDVSGDMTGVGTINTICNIQRAGSGAAIFNIVETNADINYTHLYVTSGNDVATKTRPLVLQNGYGNVGIGVITPTQKLEVNGNVKATSFIGNLDGTYVNALTGYTKATTKEDIAATDTLNVALGKLEFKTDFIYNDLFGTDNDDVINKWHEIVDFIDSVAEGTDITDEFVTRKTNLTITGVKTFLNGNSTETIKLLKGNIISSLHADGGWARNLSFGNTSRDTFVDASFGVLGSGANNTNKINYLYLAHQDQDHTTATFKVYGDKATILDNEVYHAGNDGSGSGLDADLLDGVHASGLLTALSSNKTTNLSITVGGTTKSITDLYARRLGLSSNTITSTTDDTTAKWGSLGTSVHFYNIKDQLTDQPLQYGLLLNVGGIGYDVHQIWMTQASGNLYHRGGNSTGWSGSWRTILDSVNTHIKSGVITINGTTITPLTEHQSLANYVTLDTALTITGHKTFSGGVTLSCGLNINSTNPITWNDGSYHQRIQTTDDSATNTAVFTFQQSTDAGSTWTDLFTIKDNGHVTANKFITSGGTSSQFVKGDGSLDSTSYMKVGTSGGDTAYYRTHNVNGEVWGFLAHTTALGFTIYAPTTAGTKDLVLVSNGSGAPVWSDYNSVLPVKLINDPGRTVLKDFYGLNANYGSGDYGSPREEYLLAFSKYLLDKAAGYTCIGYIRPGAAGSYICYVYDSGTNGDTGLPQHITGHYFPHGGHHYHFGTSYGAWYYYASLHSANYTNYTVTKTGGGASGTWGINISGNAATATTASKVTCTEASSDNDRPIVGTNMSNLLYYTQKATVNWSTGHIKAGALTINSVLDYSTYPETDTLKMGTTIGSIHFNGALEDKGSAITWGYSSYGGVDSGIYVKHNGSYGSKMYFATTNVWNDGPKAAMLIDNVGDIYALRKRFNGNLKITSTTQEKHIEFSRVGYNYITAPDGGTISFAVRGDIGYVNSELHITKNVIKPGTTNRTSLGTSDLRWSKVYSVLGNFSGNITLLTESGDSPSLIFLRGGIGTDALVDWRLYVTAGHLVIQNALNSVDNGSWKNVLHFNADLTNKILTSSYHIVPVSNNTLTLGTSSLKWENVYATTFTGNLSGNATTASAAAKLSSSTAVNAKEFKLSNASWTDTGYTFASLTTGTYAVQVTSGSNLVASGIMSVYTNLSDTAGDEIPLHVYGTAGWRPYLRTYANKLLISSNDISVTSRTVTIKIALIL